MAAKPKAVLVVGVLAIVIAAAASYMLYGYLKGQEARSQMAVATEKIVVAAVEIPMGTTIDMTKAKTVDWPRANMPQGGFISTKDVVGRVALDRYLPGEPITNFKLIPKEGQPGILTYKIPEGHRAMTVGVDQVSGVAGFITPGNMVDVVLTTTPSDGGQPVSKIVLQNIPALATGQIMEQQKDGKPVMVPTVTMDVTPEDAEKLAIASTQGRLQLVLRRAGDKEVAKTGGATVTKVMGSAGGTKTGGVPKKTYAGMVPKKAEATAKETVVTPVVTAPSPPSSVRVNSVEVIKGTAKTTEQFKAEE